MSTTTADEPRDDRQRDPIERLAALDVELEIVEDARRIMEERESGG